MNLRERHQSARAQNTGDPTQDARFDATDASNTALDAAYADGAGDWQAVADHDAADPAWGYPPTVVLQL